MKKLFSLLLTAFVMVGLIMGCSDDITPEPENGDLADGDTVMDSTCPAINI